KVAASGFPFLFLLALFGLRDPARTRLLAALFAALALGYSVQTEISDTIVGERYYYEAYFALCIAAARRTMLVPFARRPLAILLLFQLPLFLRFTHEALSRALPFVRVQDSIARLGLPNGVIFLQSGGRFKASDFNQNGPNWNKAALFYCA